MTATLNFYFQRFRRATEKTCFSQYLKTLNFGLASFCHFTADINIHVKETVSVLYAYSKYIIHSCILNYHNHLVQYRQFVYNTPIYILTIVCKPTVIFMSPT